LPVKSNDVLSNSKLYLRFDIGDKKESQQDSMPALHCLTNPYVLDGGSEPVRPDPMIVSILPSIQASGGMQDLLCRHN
jgi:hypothetical protein